MTAVSLDVNRGASNFDIADVTVGTSAPQGGGDIELAFNLTDANSVKLTKKDVILALKAFIRYVENSGKFGVVSVVDSPVL